MTANWQVQELDGTSVADYPTAIEADIAASQMEEDHQKPYRVRKTS